MDASTTRLYREIVRLAAEAQAHPLLAVTRGQQITALYAQIAALKAARRQQEVA
jgi:hypothetical protein